LTLRRSQDAPQCLYNLDIREVRHVQADSTADESFLFALGRSGGLCDCGEDADDEASLGSEAAGWPFFGQFVAHDITADRSALQAHVNPSGITGCANRTSAVAAPASAPSARASSAKS
jgi:hypothetical protein